MTMVCDMATGDLLRRWRQHRNLSQMALALDCGISSRHLSFIETGRARPSRDVALRLSESLGLSPQMRNQLLQAVGLASEQTEARHPAEHDLDQVMQAASTFIAASDPFPAVAIDRHWNLVAGNSASSLLLQSIDQALLRAPVNLLRLWLHPRGLASRILNLAEWRSHLMRRFQHQIDGNQDDDLRPMLNELRGYSGADSPDKPYDTPDLTMPLHIRIDDQQEPLRFMGATTLFGGPEDIVSSQIAIASFLPMNAATRHALSRFDLR